MILYMFGPTVILKQTLLHIMQILMCHFNASIKNMLSLLCFPFH